VLASSTAPTRTLAHSRTGRILMNGAFVRGRNCARAKSALESGTARSSGRQSAARSAPVLCGTTLHRPVLTSLPTQHPIALELSFNDRLVDRIEDGFDLAIRSGVIGNAAGLMTRAIGSERLIICGRTRIISPNMARPQRLDDLQASHRRPLLSRRAYRTSGIFKPAIGRKRS